MPPGAGQLDRGPGRGCWLSRVRGAAAAHACPLAAPAGLAPPPAALSRPPPRLWWFPGGESNGPPPRRQGTPEDMFCFLCIPAFSPLSTLEMYYFVMIKKNNKTTNVIF